MCKTPYELANFIAEMKHSMWLTSCEDPDYTKSEIYAEQNANLAMYESRLQEWKRELAQKELSAYVDKVAKELINDKPEEYEIGETDCGYYNNGVGMACYGKEPVYDEKQARKDAKEAIIRDLRIMARMEDTRGLIADEYVEGLFENCPYVVELIWEGVENA